MIYSTKDDISSNLYSLKHHHVALVLGTSKYSSKNKINHFYQERINGAVQLFNAHKVDYILASGDNHSLNYNEPIEMWHDLRKAGIPSDKIILDYAGFRTLDSIVRAKEIFNAQSIIIVTQKFHCFRALYLAHFYKINAQCYAVPTGMTPWRLRVREIFARVLCYIDLYLLHTQPHFLGQLEPIPS